MGVGWKEIRLGGHTFRLLRERVLYWPEYNLLVIADAHFGKITHFRKSGASLPVAAILKQFHRFSELLTSLNPQTVVFLGDLFHSGYNAEWDIFVNILKNYPSAEFFLVLGNHDILEKEMYKYSGLEVTDTLAVSNILFSHDDTAIPEEHFLICGHLHPGFILEGKGRQRLKLPCLWKTENKAVLPAYGEFTGLYIVEPDRHDTIYMITESRIISLTF